VLPFNSIILIHVLPWVPCRPIHELPLLSTVPEKHH
jgi:hypothetical protein